MKNRHPMSPCSYNANTKRTKSCPYITELAVYNILSRVAAPDLVRYRTACKLWKSLIDNPDFVDLHRSRAPESAIGSTNYPNNSTVLSSGNGRDIFLQRLGAILGSSSCGLVCVKTGTYECRVLNPATGKSLKLPPLRFDTRAMEMRVYPNSQTKQFNVVAICRYHPSMLHIYHVFCWAFFTVGVDSEWRYFQHTSGERGVRWSTVVLCESAPIFLVQHGCPKYKILEALRLDPFTGKVTTTTAPFHLGLNLAPYYFGYDKKMILSAHEWDGKFALSTFDEDEIQTWVLDDHEKNDWRYESVLEPDNEELSFSSLHSVCFVQEGKMWLRTRSRTRDLFFFDLSTSKIEKITGNGMRIYDLEPYQSTLMALDEMQ